MLEGNKPTLDYQARHAMSRANSWRLFVLVLAVLGAVFFSYWLLASGLQPLVGGTRGYMGRIEWGALRYRVVDYWWMPPGRGHTTEVLRPVRTAATFLLVAFAWSIVAVVGGWYVRKRSYPRKKTDA